MKALTFAGDDSGKMTEGEIPAALAERAQQAREQLIEAVAEADEKLMEAFFAEGTLTQEQLVAGLRAATMSGKLFPLVCTSATHAIGIQPLLDAIVSYVPSPAEREFPALDAARRRDRRGGVRARRRMRRSSGRRSPIRSPGGSPCCASSPAR